LPRRQPYRPPPLRLRQQLRRRAVHKSNRPCPERSSTFG
jgi:hypothetical protein